MVKRTQKFVTMKNMVIIIGCSDRSTEALQELLLWDIEIGIHRVYGGSIGSHCLYFYKNESAHWGKKYHDLQK